MDDEAIGFVVEPSTKGVGRILSAGKYAGFSIPERWYERCNSWDCSRSLGTRTGRDERYLRDSERDIMKKELKLQVKKVKTGVKAGAWCIFGK